MVVSKESLSSAFNSQIQDIKLYRFNVQEALSVPAETNWNSFICHTAITILHNFVDSFHMKATFVSDFKQLQEIIHNCMRLEFDPCIKNDKVYFFGLAKPCILLSCFKLSNFNHGHLELDELSCKDLRIAVLVAAFAIYLDTLQIDMQKRIVIMMIKATLNECRVFKIHSADKNIETIASLLNVRDIDLLDEILATLGPDK